MPQALILCGSCPSLPLASKRFLPPRPAAVHSCATTTSSSSTSSSGSNCTTTSSSSYNRWNWSIEQLSRSRRRFQQQTSLLLPPLTIIARAKKKDVNAGSDGDDQPASFETVKKEVTRAAKKAKEKQKHVSSSTTSNVRIGVYFLTWWGLNIVFNVYNKKVLNVYPFPWLTSVLALLAGTVIMLASWCTGCIPSPDTNLEFWKGLFPVAVAHSIGHVAATISMARSAVAFTHIIKSAEPAFSVLLSRFFLSEKYSMPVYMSLLPVVGGCCLSVLTELNFDMIGFISANVSNVAFVFRNYFSKRGMSKKMSGLNYYGCLCMMSLAILTPFAIAFEGFQAWSLGWQMASRAIGRPFFWWMLAQSVFYHLYNQVSYMSLDQISPLTFSIGNTMKRVTVIGASLIIFRTPVKPINLIGAAVAILGTFLYAQATK